MIPWNYFNKSPVAHEDGKFYNILFNEKDKTDFSSNHATEAEAKAAMLIHLLENNIITAEEINQRLVNS
jgi:hypothetical protein